MNPKIPRAFLVLIKARLLSSSILMSHCLSSRNAGSLLLVLTPNSVDTKAIRGEILTVLDKWLPIFGILRPERPPVESCIVYQSVLFFQEMILYSEF